MSYNKDISNESIVSEYTEVNHATPASIEEEWYANAVFHRQDGPAIYLDEQWYLQGPLHRNRGPADLNEWYLHGPLHRDQGPAIETAETSETVIVSEWSPAN